MVGIMHSMRKTDGGNPEPRLFVSHSRGGAGGRKRLSHLHNAREIPTSHGADCVSEPRDASSR